MGPYAALRVSLAASEAGTGHYIKRTASGIAHDPRGISGDIGAGSVSNLLSSRQLSHLLQAFQHDARRQDAAHADLVIAHGVKQLAWIQALQRRDRLGIDPASFGITGVVVHITGDDQQRRLATVGQHLGQSASKFPAAIEIAVAHGDANDADMGCKSGQQRQFHLDGMFLLMGLGIQLQPGNRFTQLLGQLRVGRNIDTPGSDQVWQGATAHSTPKGVCLGPITITVSGISIRLRTSAAMRPE